MKHALTFLAAVMLIGSALAQHKHADKGPNGGQMEDVAGVHAELLVPGNTLTLNIFNEDSKPVPTKGFSGSALIVAGTDKEAVSLSPSGENVLKADAKKPINIAKKYIGVRYKRGGTNPRSGFDCSGFTRYVYKMAGKKIPRTSSAQRRSGKTVSRAHARPGDLVWFKDFRHVAIYAGNGYIIDAPKPGKKVTKRKLWTSHVKYIRVST